MSHEMETTIRVGATALECLHEDAELVRKYEEALLLERGQMRGALREALPYVREGGGWHLAMQIESLLEPHVRLPHEPRAPVAQGDGDGAA